MLSAIDDRVITRLQSTFGFESFRPLQEEIVRSILDRRDVFVLMPTGGGKSLCYQLPALLSDGVTLVVSPLIALMKDQVDALGALGVNATYINSSLDGHEIAQRQRGLVNGEYALVYVAPERLMTPGFLRLLSQIRVAFIAIDEAHCISEWGHDFRPEYRRLRELREVVPDIPCAAFTATATSRVQADIVAQLGLKSPATFRGSFNRSNLFYEVRPADRKYDQLANYLEQHPSSSGIVYCFSRRGTEELAARLTRDRFPAAAYHAGLEAMQRRDRQDSFIRDDVPIIVATIAFGMGIDKSDVRFVVHYDLPKSLEGYYQESGRAGRDGERSDCILFFDPGDIVKQRRFISEKPDPQERNVAEWQLRQMVDYAEASTCRRQAILAYFGEHFEGQDGVCCDNCASPPELDDYTIPAQMLLSCVKRTGERFGLMHVIQVLRGAKTERIQSLGHDKLSTYGTGKGRSEHEWRRIGNELIRGGFLEREDGQYSTVRVSRVGDDVLFRGVGVSLPKQHTARLRIQDEVANPELYERLRDLRKRLADERGLPPYVVFHDRPLKEMAATLPVTKKDLLGISGIGWRKVEDFGDAMLAEIFKYVCETGATPKRPAAVLRPAQSDSTRHSVELFQRGMSPADIAAERSLSPSTIASHLANALEAGEDLEIDRLIDPARLKLIEAAMEELGGDSLGPIREHLGEEYSYDELKYVRALRNARPKQAAQNS